MNKLTSLFELAKFTWNNSEKLHKLLLLFLKRLPTIIRVLEDAGQRAILAGQTIQGENELPGAAQMINTASVAIGDCKIKLDLISSGIANIQGTFNGLTIPTVSFNDKNFPLLGGLAGYVTVPAPTITDCHPLSIMSDCLSSQKTYVDHVSGQLGKAEEELQGLSDKINDAGTQLKQIGADLREVSAILKEVDEI